MVVLESFGAAGKMLVVPGSSAIALRVERAKVHGGPLAQCHPESRLEELDTQFALHMSPLVSS